MFLIGDLMEPFGSSESDIQSLGSFERDGIAVDIIGLRLLESENHSLSSSCMSNNDSIVCHNLLSDYPTLTSRRMLADEFAVWDTISCAISPCLQPRSVEVSLLLNEFELGVLIPVVESIDTPILRCFRQNNAAQSIKAVGSKCRSSSQNNNTLCVAGDSVFDFGNTSLRMWNSGHETVVNFPYGYQFGKSGDMFLAKEDILLVEGNSSSSSDETALSDCPSTIPLSRIKVAAKICGAMPKGAPGLLRSIAGKPVLLLPCISSDLEIVDSQASSSSSYGESATAATAADESCSVANTQKLCKSLLANDSVLLISINQNMLDEGKPLHCERIHVLIPEADSARGSFLCFPLVMGEELVSSPEMTLFNLMNSREEENKASPHFGNHDAFNIFSSTSTIPRFASYLPTEWKSGVGTVLDEISTKGISVKRFIPEKRTSAFQIPKTTSRESCKLMFKSDERKKKSASSLASPPRTRRLRRSVASSSSSTTTTVPLKKKGKSKTVDRDSMLSAKRTPRQVLPTRAMKKNIVRLPRSPMDGADEGELFEVFEP